MHLLMCDFLVIGYLNARIAMVQFRLSYFVLFHQAWS